MLSEAYIAGEDLTIVLPFLVQDVGGADYVVPDSGSVTYSVRDHYGVVFADLKDVSLTTDDNDTEKTITITQAHNVKTLTFERRTIEYKFTSNGAKFTSKHIYWLVDYVNIDPTPADVRAVLGVAEAELRDTDINLLRAYYKLINSYGETTVVAALNAGNIDTINMNKALVLTEALELAPSLPLRLNKTQRSGVEEFSRYDVDVSELIKRLQLELAAVISSVSKAPVESYPLFILGNSRDAYNPYDE